MSTITVILTPDADGTLHLPVPADAPSGSLKVTATIESAEIDWVARRMRALAALNRLAERGGIQSIPDPSAWQREQRQDRPLAGREQ